MVSPHLSEHPEEAYPTEFIELMESGKDASKPRRHHSPVHRCIAIREGRKVVFGGIIGFIPSDYNLYHPDRRVGMFRNFLQEEGVEREWF